MRSSLKSVYFILLQLSLIRNYGLIPFRNTAEIMNLYRIWQNSLGGGSARRKASTYTEYDNTG
jgi:hypothetical protein